MSPSKSPSSDRQNTVYPSHLQEMKRPVRSFKSFIRATLQAPDKPFQPIHVRPLLQKNPSSSSSIATVQTRGTGSSLWESPNNWDNGEGSQAQHTSLFAVRQYSLLIPEPPKDIAAMQADPVLWKQNNRSFQQTPLDPIHERTAAAPDIPPRNPSRLLLALSSPATTRHNSKDTLPSISSRYSANTDDGERLAECFHDVDLPSPLDLISALSDMSIKDRAFDSLGLGSPRDQRFIWYDPHQRSDSVQLEDTTHLNMQGSRVTTFRKGRVLAGDSLISPRAPEMSDKMQALSLAQDYHNVLTNRSFDDGLAPAKTPPKDRDLTPHLLAWDKSADASPTEPSSRPQLAPTTSSRRYEKIRKVGSWVNYRPRKELQTVAAQRSISDPGTHSRVQLSEAEVDGSLRHDARLANIMQRGKDLLSRRLRRRDSEPRKPMIVSLSRRQRSEASSDEPMVSKPTPSETKTPMFRLPGDRAIVGQSPLSTQRPQIASDSPSPTFLVLSGPDFTVSSPFLRDFSRRSTCPSPIPPPQRSPFAAMKQKLSSSLDWPVVPRLFSHSATSLASPQPHDDASAPYSAPQPRRRSHNIGSPLSVSLFSHEVEAHPDELSKGSTSKLNLFEKAKYARDERKKQQKDAKNEKLKQSIRLVGPADAKHVAGYIEFAVDGRHSGDSGIGDGQFPVHMVKELS